MPLADTGVTELVFAAVYGGLTDDSGEANRAMCSGVFSHMYIYVIKFGE